MNTSTQNLLSDAIFWLKESYAPDTSLLVSKEQVITVSKQTQVSAPKKQIAQQTEAPPQILLARTKSTKAPPPLQKETSLTKDLPSPLVEKENLIPFAELFQKTQKYFPGFSLEKELLSDHKGLLPVLHKTSLVLSFREGRESDVFLHNVCKAMERSFASAGLWDATQCSSTEELQLLLEQVKAKIILAPVSLLQNPIFLPFIKEIPSSSSRFLGKSKLLVLEPFENYFTNPLQKKILWHTICTHLTIPNTPSSS